MTWRAPLLLALAASLLVTLAYQRQAPASVTLGTSTDSAITDGFGGPGRTGGRPWRWTTAQSQVRLRGAGQIAPAGATLRVELGLPRWAADRPRRVTLALDGRSLGAVVVTSGFALHEFEIAPHGEPGDWVLSIATQGVYRKGGDVRGVALGEVVLLPSPPPASPPPRTLLLALLGVVGLLAFLAPWTGRFRATLVALAGAAALAAGLALARQPVVLALPTATWTMAILLAGDRIRREGWLPRLAEWLARPGRAWVEWATPPVALAALGLPGLGLWPVPAFALSLLIVAFWVARARLVPSRDSEAEEPWRREALLVAGLTAVGLAFRFYDLEGIPFAIFRDEARHGLLALRLLADPSYRPLFVGPPINQPLPYFLGVGAAIRAFGVDLFALRFVSALAGALRSAAPLPAGARRVERSRRPRWPRCFSPSRAGTCRSAASPSTTSSRACSPSRRICSSGTPCREPAPPASAWRPSSSAWRSTPPIRPSLC